MKVMFADDDADLRAVVGRIMVEDGHAFCGVGDGTEVLARLDEERPDIIILDIAMPHMDGFETCQRLRRRGVRTPVIFLSAKAISSTKALVSGLAATTTSPSRSAP